MNVNPPDDVLVKMTARAERAEAKLASLQEFAISLKAAGHWVADELLARLYPRGSFNE